MAPNFRPSWRFSRIEIGILIAAGFALFVGGYRYVADEAPRQEAEDQARWTQESQPALHVEVARNPYSWEEIENLDAPPYWTVADCLGFDRPATVAADKGLLDRQGAENLTTLVTRLSAQPMANEIDRVHLEKFRAKAYGWIEAPDRAMLAVALERCTKLVSEKLAE